jgi:hypothetical protein
MSGNLFLSITYQDEIVDYKENVVFSERLTARGINHTLYMYDGKHRDPFPGIFLIIDLDYLVPVKIRNQESRT